MADLSSIRPRNLLGLALQNFGNNLRRHVKQGQSNCINNTYSLAQAHPTLNPWPFHKKPQEASAHTCSWKTRTCLEPMLHNVGSTLGIAVFRFKRQPSTPQPKLTLYQSLNTGTVHSSHPYSIHLAVLISCAKHLYGNSGGLSKTKLSVIPPMAQNSVEFNRPSAVATKV